MDVRTKFRRPATVALVGVMAVFAACTPDPPVTPVTPPGPIAAVVATAGIESASLDFAAPAPGTDPVLSYEVSINGGVEIPLAADRIVPGLAAGTPFLFRVRACSSAGCGPLSPPSNSVTPLPSITTPAVVGTVVATPGNQSASLAYAAPADGGSPITSYEVSVNGGAPVTLAGSNTVGGLGNGTAYSFRVSACNVVGCGELSAPSNSVVPRTVPSAPAVGASVSGTTINWSWNVPANNGSPVTSFEVRLDGNLVQGGLGTSFSRGFGYSETHTLTVVAVNAAGAGPAGSATRQTGGPPPRSVSLNWGSPTSVTGCTSNCFRMVVTIANFPPNSSFTLRCEYNTGSGWRSDFGWTPPNIVTNGSGSGGSGDNSSNCVGSPSGNWLYRVRVDGGNVSNEIG